MPSFQKKKRHKNDAPAAAVQSFLKDLRQRHDDEQKQKKKKKQRNKRHRDEDNNNEQQQRQNEHVGEKHRNETTSLHVMHDKKQQKKKQKRAAVLSKEEIMSKRTYKHHHGDTTSNNNEDNDHVNTKRNQPEKVATKQGAALVSSSSSSRPSTVIITPTSTSPRRTTAPIRFDHTYILAPMVGASELPFRLLCRKYGAQACYTPMMSAHQFSHSAAYRQAEFSTCPADRPLVCHFHANTAADFAAAAVAAAPYCDAIDLNLGCPQRTAYVGHFGSYLLDDVDRPLLCAMVSAAAAAVPNVPIFCKIRLLPTVEQTVELVQQLASAGASLVAIHARYRASWERTAASARDGPAFLDQVAHIQRIVAKSHPALHIVTNGNTITWHDVVQNLQLTNAAGLMSAEGILDNPALFLPRFGAKDDDDNDNAMVPVLRLSTTVGGAGNSHENDNDPKMKKMQKKQRRLQKKMRAIDTLEQRAAATGSTDSLTSDERELLASKPSVTKKWAKLQQKMARNSTSNTDDDDDDPQSATTTMVPLRDLYQTAADPWKLALEYVDLALAYPAAVKVRSVIFHVRRMIKDLLVQYQLLQDCLACQTIQQVKDDILLRIQHYRKHPELFVLDQRKAAAEKEALERQKQQEGKRRAYEARMMRKAKREGKSDLLYYLKIGAEVPSKRTIEQLKQMPRPQAMKLWKEKHSQHCLAFHLDREGCQRERTCAFLHVECGSASAGGERGGGGSRTDNTFVEQDEVAG